MVKRVRATLSWQPSWEGTAKSWAIGFISKNRWRCDRIHEFDDLLQDAYLTFLRICNKYPRVVGPAHFMTLYRMAMNNEMHDRARYVKRKREIHEDTSVDPTELGDRRIGEVTNGGFVSVVIANAPEPIKQALSCLIENPPELHQATGYRENLNMKLCRVLGYQRTDLMGGLRSLLQA